MRRFTFALVLLALVGIAPPASAHPFAVGKTTFHDGVDKACKIADGNAAPYAAPSKEHPWGTVITGCFRSTYDKTIAVVREWDLFHARSVREVTFPADNDDDSIRVAAANGRILAIVSAAMQDPVDHAVLRLLDDKLAVVRKWDLGVGGWADIDADGTLAAVTLDAWNNGVVDIAGGGLALRTVDMARGRITGTRFFRYRQATERSIYHPAGTVRIHDGEIFVAFAEGHDAKAFALSSTLRILAGRSWAHVDPGIGPIAATCLLTPGVDGVVVWHNEQLEVLRSNLTLKKKLGTPPDVPHVGSPRWAVDPDTGRVATEDGRVAPNVGAPFKRFMNFTRESVLRGLKLEIFADRTTAVLWAFGRVVIVREAPGLGVLAFEPPAPGSAPDRQHK